MENIQFDLFWLFRILRKHLMSLLVVCFITLSISSVFSLFFMQEKFESFVTIFPTITNAASTSLETALEFGGEGEAEQLLEVLNSNEIRDSIILKFNLFQRYELNPDELYAKTKINELYLEHISFKKTRFNSIKISVLDHDPHIASDIANEYLALIDLVMTRIRQDRADQAISILEKRKELLTLQKDVAQDSLKRFHALGMIKIAHQTERLTEQYAIALAANNISGANRIKKELNLFAKHVGPMEEALRKTWKIEDELAEISILSDKIKVDAEYTYHNKFVISRAFPADKKSYPVRWLVVFSSLISVLSFTVLLIVIIESGLLKYNEQ